MIGDKANNRRRGPDTLTKAITIFAGLSWLLVFLAFVFYVSSKPRGASLYNMRFSVAEDTAGNPSFLLFANIALILVIIACLTGFMINMSRNRRKSDRFSKSLIFIGIGSIIWLLFNLLFN
jgi:hypothetical protein